MPLYSKLQIATLLVQMYSNALPDVKNAVNKDEAILACRAHEVASGVCRSISTFGNSSMEMARNYSEFANIIAKHCDPPVNNQSYWGILPCRCQTKYEVVSSIEYRLMILEEVLEELLTNN